MMLQKLAALFSGAVPNRQSVQNNEQYAADNPVQSLSALAATQLRCWPLVKGPSDKPVWDIMLQTAYQAWLSGQSPAAPCHGGNLQAVR